MPPIPKASEIYYEDAVLMSRPDERPRKMWVVIRWRTPKGRKVDHDTVIEFVGRTRNEVWSAFLNWVRSAKAKRVNWPTSWNSGKP
jgi:hypothetical protein